MTTTCTTGSRVVAQAPTPSFVHADVFPRNAWFEASHRDADRIARLRGLMAHIRGDDDTYALVHEDRVHGSWSERRNSSTERVQMLVLL